MPQALDCWNFFQLPGVETPHHLEHTNPFPFKPHPGETSLATSWQIVLWIPSLLRIAAPPPERWRNHRISEFRTNPGHPNHTNFLALRPTIAYDKRMNPLRRVVAITLFLLLATLPPGNAGATPPVVIPTSGAGTTTQTFGNGYITRGPNGETYTTQKFGTGYITRGPNGQTWTTTSFGSAAITRGPNGRSITTSKFGNGYISRDNKGGTTTTTPFGQGYINRGPSGSVTTNPSGTGYTSRGTAGGNKTSGGVLVLPPPPKR